MAAIDGIEHERSIGGGKTRETRGSYWKAAKGLQAVDGLEASQYLDTAAEGHIEGRHSSSRAVDLVEEHYDRKASRSEETASKEADLVSSPSRSCVTSARTPTIRSSRSAPSTSGGTPSCAPATRQSATA